MEKGDIDYLLPSRPLITPITTSMPRISAFNKKRLHVRHPGSVADPIYDYPTTKRTLC